MMNWHLQTVQTSLEALAFPLQFEFCVAYKMVISAIILVLALIFKQWVDFEMILLATGLVLMSKLFNSVIEAI